MRVHVIYCSRTGNTKKVAEAMASELKTEAVSVKSLDKPEKTFLFLGSGFYGGSPGKEMMDFIEKNDFSGLSVALFGTSGSGEGKEVLLMEQAFRNKGVSIRGKLFCRGKFLLFNRGRPSEEDLKKAREFARKMAR